MTKRHRYVSRLNRFIQYSIISKLVIDRLVSHIIIEGESTHALTVVRISCWIDILYTAILSGTNESERKLIQLSLILNFKEFQGKPIKTRNFCLSRVKKTDVKINVHI